MTPFILAIPPTQRDCPHFTRNQQVLIHPARIYPVSSRNVSESLGNLDRATRDKLPVWRVGIYLCDRSNWAYPIKACNNYQTSRRNIMQLLLEPKEQEILSWAVKNMISDLGTEIGHTENQEM